MSLLGKSAAAFAGYKGVKGGVKAMAAIAAGRWLYNKWQTSNGSRRSSSDMI